MCQKHFPICLWTQYTCQLPTLMHKHVLKPAPITCEPGYICATDRDCSHARFCPVCQVCGRAEPSAHVWAWPLAKSMTLSVQFAGRCPFAEGLKFSLRVSGGLRGRVLACQFACMGVTLSQGFRGRLPDREIRTARMSHAAYLFPHFHTWSG